MDCNIAIPLSMALTNTTGWDIGMMIQQLFFLWAITATSHYVLWEMGGFMWVCLKIGYIPNEIAI